MNLKNLIREIHDGQSIYPSDIFNMYYLETLYGTEPGLFNSDYGQYILQTFTAALKKKYIAVFKQLLADQLTKYAARKRTDQDFDAKAISPNASAAVLWDLMKKTFRSDMQRRNDVWNLIAEYTTKLEQSKRLKDTFTYINMLNNCVHNTNTSVLGKIDHSHRLVQAYDLVAKAKSVAEYEKYVDKDLRRLRSQGQ